MTGAVLKIQWDQVSSSLCYQCHPVLNRRIEIMLQYRSHSLCGHRHVGDGVSQFPVDGFSEYGDLDWFGKDLVSL